MALRSEDLSQVTPLAIQYRDYAMWQKQEAQVHEHERQLAYWKEQLQGSQPASFLCDKPRPGFLSGDAGVIQLQIQGSVYDSLQAFCRSHYMTQFTVLLAVFRIAHYRLTDIDDATIGTPIANRNRPELEELIGFFVNTQCMRITIDSEHETFNTLARKVRSIATAAFENQDVPFERIVSSLMPGSRDTSRNPLVQTSFAFHSQDDLGKLELEGATSELLSSRPTTRLDLEFHVFPTEKGLGGSILYATDLFNVETVQNIVDIFQEALHRCLEQPDAYVSSIPLTAGLVALKDLGLLEVNKTHYPRDSTVVDLFREQVDAHPTNFAVIDSASNLTYAELDERSDRVANWLRQYHLPAETLIGVLAPRSCQTITAYIGILKANLAYLPLDINVPLARNQLILSTLLGRKIVLLGSSVAIPETLTPGVEWVQLDDVLAAKQEVIHVTDADKPHAKSLAYVMFTSGSTGLPKGVMIEHRGINRLVKSGLLYNMPQMPRVAHLSNIAFDNSTWEVYIALLNGGTVICIDYFTTLDYKALESVFIREKIQAALLLPSLLKQLLVHAPNAISALDVVLAAGDRFNGRDALETQRRLRVGVYNAYGPTENSVTSTIYAVKGDEDFTNGVPIGQTINNSGAYIIDSKYRSVSIGVMGELIVTGDGVARGYTDSRLDKDRFIEISINGESVRAYRTGDRARFRPGDGQLEFFGRIDQQIKVRGHRMEPAEIEQAILEDIHVLDAVVVLRKSTANEVDLVGFIVLRDANAKPDLVPIREKALIQRLQTILPSYMVPARIIELEDMPLNANGKNDRLELTHRAQKVDRGGNKVSAPIAPRNEIETALCEEFSSVLGVEVGIADNFFDLGGHSLIATKLAARLSERFHSHISVKNIFDQPIVMGLAGTIKQNSIQYRPIEFTPYTGPVEQSFAQGRLWFLEQLSIGSKGYLVPLAVRLHGNLQIKCLEIALQALTQRHETLRTTFEDHDGVGRQVVQSCRDIQLEIVNIPTGDNFMEYLRKDQRTPFNLESDPGWRVTLFKVGDQDFILSIIMHHIISDGWSLDILQQELATFYSAALHNKAPLSMVPALPIQYRDFAVWQKQPAQQAEHERQLEFWRKHLDGSQPASFLGDKPRPAKLSSKADAIGIEVEEPVYHALQKFCQVNQVTPFAALFAVFRATHYRLTGSQDATIGTPIANRNRSELENLIGFFVNTQCIRTTVTEENSFYDLTSHVKSVISAAIEHQDVPFERIVSTVLPGSRDTSRNPLTQLMFALTTGSDTGKIQLEGLENEPLAMEPTTRFDVEFNLVQEEDRLYGYVIFSTDIFEPDTIRNSVEIFQEMLRKCLEQPTMPISALPLTLGLTELRHMGLFDMKTTEYPRDASIVDIFNAQVAAHPNRIAVTDSSCDLTYRQLDDQSNQIATYLHYRQMAPETIVGVLGPRSCRTIATLLGILKANLAYLPLDVNAPSIRNESLLSEVPGLTLLLLGDDVNRLDGPSANVEQISISQVLELSKNRNIFNCPTPPSATATSLAYVMFTSGSSGRPKGVMIEHRGIVRLVKATNVISHYQAAKPIAHISNLAFDAATWEIYTPLLNGGTIVCIDQMTVLDLEALGQIFTATGVTTALVAVALLTQLLSEAPHIVSGLDLLYVGGDVLRANDAVRARDLVKSGFYNAYGPTENTTVSAIYAVGLDELYTNGVPIGKPVSNSGAYVMSTQLQIVPVGVMGELVLTGDGLARGYTDPAFNNKFVYVEIAGRSVRAYRTGDRARYRPADGQIEYFGRMDQQVKIRGHRVEPTEIEHIILTVDTISDAAVVVRKDEGHDPGLVGFVTIRNDVGATEQKLPSLTEKDILQRLRVLLPGYMVPEQVLILDKLPLNANGKVDRRELTRVALKTSRASTTESQYAPPRNEVELALCEEFTKLLGVKVGITDNFFDLGGHSIMATKLAARISRRLDARVSIADIFDRPTLVDLAAGIRRGSNSHAKIKSTPYSGPVKQSFAQGRLWFLDKLNPGATWYFMPLAVRLRGPLQIKALTIALNATEERHEILRTTFKEHDGIGVQVVHGSQAKPLHIIDVSDKSYECSLSLLRQEQEVPFNISSEAGWRVALFRLSTQDHILSIMMHHIISDGWSVDILRQDLARFYTAALQGRDPLAQVTPLPIQYRDFSTWQKSMQQVIEHQKQLEYWTEQLTNSSPAELFCDKPRPAIASGEAGIVQFTIEGSLYKSLESYCRARQVTPFTVLLAAFRATHFRLTGSEDATIGTPIANRNRPELEEMIGFFVNTQCIRLIIEDESFDGLVENARTTTSAAFENQDVPFERIVSALLPGLRDTSRNPLIQLMFAVHSQKSLGRIEFEGLISEPLPAGSTTRFDLEFHMFQGEGGLGGNVHYAVDLFEPATISNFVDVFWEILRRCLVHPDIPIASIPLTDGLAVLDDLSYSKVETTKTFESFSVVDVFLQQVAAYPERIAVKDATTQLTYAELDQKSDQLSAWLRQQCMPDEALVGVLAPRSCQTIIAFLAILKSNLAYLPLDTNTPTARLETILSNAPNLTLVLLGIGISAPDICLPNIEFAPLADIPTPSLPNFQDVPANLSLPSPKSLAYVIFTSGSTGQPKGVMIEHRGIVRLVKNSNVTRKLPEEVKIAHLSNIAFDASVLEIYSALLNGLSLICIDYFTTLDSEALKTIFARENIGMAIISPALLKQCLVNIPATIGALDILYVAGDRLDPADAKQARALVKTAVYNAYGPTENTVLSTIFQVDTDQYFEQGVPIGSSVSNSGAYIMDPNQHLVSLGVMGELVVTGDGLARGYTNSALNSNRFVHVTIDGQSIRAYRTGDRARCRPSDGYIEFFGRMDQQIKIRGHRIEPAEVEFAILKHPHVCDAAVVARFQADQEPEMVAFVTTEKDQSIQKEVAEQIDGWGTHFETNVYAEIQSIDNSIVGNDFMGWTSMYDGSMIDKNQMKEWLEETIATLLDGKPAGRVLEIGVGTGMILFNLGAGLTNYIGLEPSSSAASFVNKSIESTPSLAGKAHVHVGTALDTAHLTSLVENPPDLVVINSVAQYFPSAEYLMQVIQSLVRLPGVKRLFFGDMRTYATNKSFLAGRSLHTLGKDVSKESLRRKIAELEDHEEELLVDPAFFTGLLGQIPDSVWHVEILPKRMEATNELSMYRYAAVIHVCNTKEPANMVQPIDQKAWVDFQTSSLDRDSLLALLQGSKSPYTLAVGNIPYSKTMFDKVLSESLIDGENEETQTLIDGAAWVSKIRSTAEQRTALSALDLVQIGEKAGFRVELSWARQRSQRGGIDAVFHQIQPHSIDSRVLFQFPTEDQGRSSDLLTNRPIQRHRNRKIAAQIKEKLQTLLPSYMIPTQIVAIDQMPVNANGKIDRRELTRKAQAARVNRPSSERIEPRNEAEKTLCENFADVLGVEVGIADNFFELGGHSLMATKLAARLSQRMSVHVSVRDIFDNPTPMELASRISHTLLEGKKNVIIPMADLKPFELLHQSDPADFVKKELAPRLPLSCGEVKDAYPVTWSQKVFIHDARTEKPWIPSYFCIKFPAASDIKRLADVSAALVQHFDIFRTVFLAASGKFYGVVLDALDVPIEEIELKEDLNGTVRKLFDQDERNPLSLGCSMLRISIIKEQAFGVGIVLRMNHALYDGVSLEQIVAALHALYHGDRLSTPPKFSRYVQFMMQSLEGGYKFWRSVLGNSSMTNFRTIRTNSNMHWDETEGQNGTWVATKLIKAPRQTNSYGITPATMFTTACSLVLGQETGSNDVVFGRVVSGRQSLPANLQHVVGSCATAVPVRVRLGEDIDPIELLRQVQEQYLDSLPFETLGLDDIRENCTDWPETVVNFSCYTAYQNFDMNPRKEKNNQSIHMVTLDRDTSPPEVDKDDPSMERWESKTISMHDIDVAGEPQPDGVHVRIILGINQRLCEKSTVDRILNDVCNRFQMLGSALQDGPPSV